MRPVEAVFHLTRTCWKRGKEVFIIFFVSCFIPSFFLERKLLLKLGGSQFLKDKPYSCQWTSIFQFFRDFSKWKQLFRIVKTFFSIFFTRLSCKQIFYLVETVLFGQCYFTVIRNHYWNTEKTVLRERRHSCW